MTKKSFGKLNLVLLMLALAMGRHSRRITLYRMDMFSWDPKWGQAMVRLQFEEVCRWVFVDVGIGRGYSHWSEPADIDWRLLQLGESGFFDHHVHRRTPAGLSFLQTIEASRRMDSISLLVSIHGFPVAASVSNL